MPLLKRNHESESGCLVDGADITCTSGLYDCNGLERQPPWGLQGWGVKRVAMAAEVEERNTAAPAESSVYLSTTQDDYS